jgi:predicted nucleic acid-binding protein
MIVLIDTSVLSLAFRRRDPATMTPHEAEVANTAKRLALTRKGMLIGMVRQEALSGVRNKNQFDNLKTILDGFALTPTEMADHDAAAECFNQCRARGVAAGDVDMLICAIAIRTSSMILTVDNDFAHYARCLPISLYDVP